MYMYVLLYRHGNGQGSISVNTARNGTAPQNPLPDYGSGFFYFLATTKMEREMEKVISEEILKAVKGVRFGSVQIIIQDSKVVQIDKTEKIRLEQNCRKGGDA